MAFLLSEGVNPCSLNDVLVCFTRADEIPPLRFPQVCNVVFLIMPGWQLPALVTCSYNCPLVMEKIFHPFKKPLSILGNDGFGGV